jgi:hypothetical protein
MENGKTDIYRQLASELLGHVPFTALGAIIGILTIVALKGLSGEKAMKVFYVLHPLHVFFSGIVTAALYRRHKKRRNKAKVNVAEVLLIGYIGAVGVATLSDSLIPYLGEFLLGLPERKIHLGFIEKWWLVNPLALLGACAAYFWPKTKFSHLGHVLLSTYASLFHILSAMGRNNAAIIYVLIMMFLFLAVWLPCCLSDIIIPVLVGESAAIAKKHC